MSQDGQNSGGRGSRAHPVVQFPKNPTVVQYNRNCTVYNFYGHFQQPGSYNMGFSIDAAGQANRNRGFGQQKGGGFQQSQPALGQQQPLASSSGEQQLPPFGQKPSTI